MLFERWSKRFGFPALNFFFRWSIDLLGFRHTSRHYLAELESSILVEGNSTVNAGNPRTLFRLEEGSAVVMAVTTAQSGRHSRCVAFKQGTSGQPAGEKKFVAE